MRISLLLLTFGILQVNATVYSQSTKLSLNAKNESLRDIFKEIESKSLFRFFYSDNLMVLDKVVNVDVQNTNVEQILDKLLENTDYAYKVLENNLVVIAPKSYVARQNDKVTGTVTDASTGEPIIGANVLVEGTKNGAVTDVNGKFTLTGISAESVIQISYVGYLTEKVSPNGQATVVVKLTPDITKLSEVVVVGYGEQKRRDVTGATATVKASVITSRPITRVEQALQGTTAGVLVQSNSGQPGSSISVRIRGVNSLTGSNDPLYVIDGFIGGNIESITPEEIESLEILKDASSTAIYGSRGANGVVLITTKHGKEGKMKVDVNAWVSQANMPRYLDLMNAYDFATTRNRIDEIKGVNPSFTQDQLNGFRTNSTDWQKEITRSVMIQNYQLALSGGTQNVKYMVSGSYVDQPGLILNSFYKKGSMRANLDVKASEKFDFKFQLSGYQSYARNNDYGGNSWEPLPLSGTWAPTSPVKNADGTYVLHSFFGDDRISPVVYANDNVRDYNNYNFAGQAMVNYHIIKNLTFTSTLSYSSLINQNPTYAGLLANGETKTDFASQGNSTYRSFQNSNYFTYNLNLGAHEFTVTALYEQQTNKYLGAYARANQLENYNNGYYNLGLTSLTSVSSSSTADAIQSYMGRINYSYKSRYLLTASLRYDGSSHLTEKYSSFPSLAAAWNISNESFFQNAKRVISSLKLRLSYGKTGNQNVPAYATIPTINIGNPYYFTDQKSISTPYGPAVSKKLKWETTDQLNAGVDFQFLEGRIYFTADVYKKKISDLLYNYPSPAYLSNAWFESYSRNIGSIENKGLEFSLGGIPVTNNKFKWNTFFTISFNRNKIADLGDLNGQSLTLNGSSQGQSGVMLLKTGEPTGVFYGYKFLGTWKTSEAVEAAKYGATPGSSKFLDVNGDGQYGSDDLMVIGHGQPDYTLGFINDLTYGPFTLNFMFQGMVGNQIYSYLQAEQYGNTGDAKDATSTDVRDKMWTPTVQTDFPVPGLANNFTNSSRYVYNGSFVKLKNISLSYRLPQVFTTKMRMSNLEVYVSSQNLFTITKYKGYDPETTNATGALTQGLEAGSLPNPRTFTFGVRAGF